MCFIKNTIKSSAFFSFFFFAFLQYLIFVRCCCSGVGMCQLKIQCHFVHIIMQLENLTFYARNSSDYKPELFPPFILGPTYYFPAPLHKGPQRKTSVSVPQTLKLPMLVIYMRMKTWSLKRVHEKPSIENVLINVFYLSFLTRFFFLTNPNEITLSKNKNKKN